MGHTALVFFCPPVHGSERQYCGRGRGQKESAHFDMPPLTSFGSSKKLELILFTTL